MVRRELFSWKDWEIEDQENNIHHTLIIILSQLDKNTMPFPITPILGTTNEHARMKQPKFLERLAN